MYRIGQSGTLSLPKTADSSHMQDNAKVDMELLKAIQRIRDHGEFSVFPVYGGKRNEEENRHEQTLYFLPHDDLSGR